MAASSKRSGSQNYGHCAHDDHRNMAQIVQDAFNVLSQAQKQTIVKVTKRCKDRLAGDVGRKLLSIIQNVHYVKGSAPGASIQDKLGYTNISDRYYRSDATNTSLREVAIPHYSFYKNIPWNPLDDDVINIVRSKLECNDLGYHCEIEHAHKSIDMTAFVQFPECDNLYEIVRGCYTKKKSYNISVQGLPGTGKTVSLKWIEKQMLGHADVKFSYINAYSAGDGDILKALAKNITNESNLKVKDIISNATENMHIMVIDEIDRVSEHELIEFYSLCTIQGAWCICIGISNVLNFTKDRRLDRLKFRGIGPQSITFKPFESVEILNILRKRLLQLPYDVFDSKVIDFIGKSCSKSGDIRSAFKVADFAIQNCVTRARNDSQTVSNLVQINDVFKNSSNKNSFELTVPQLLLLRTLYNARKRRKNLYDISQMFSLLIDYNHEKDLYLKLRSLRKCPVLDVNGTTELLSHCDSLACIGVVDEVQRRSSTYLRLAMSDADARSILKTQNFIS